MARVADDSASPRFAVKEFVSTLMSLTSSTVLELLLDLTPDDDAEVLAAAVCSGYSAAAFAASIRAA